MIQRVQSIWLFLASMVSGLLLMPSMTIYSYNVPQGFGGVIHRLSASNFYPLLVFAVLMTLLPLVTIFLFQNRKRQKSMAFICLLSAISFMVVMFMKIGNINNGTPTPNLQQYGILAAAIPVVFIIFIFLAIRGIRKDDKLIKSLDRLR